MFPGFKKQSLEKETKKAWQQSDKYFYQEPTGPTGDFLEEDEQANTGNTLPREKSGYVLSGAGPKDEMKCGNCGETSEKWQYIRLTDNVALKGGRGSASMVQKCKLCSRENSIEILSSTIKPYNAEDNEKFKTIVEFECRGLEPVDFQPQAGFAAEGLESGTVFSDINLQEKDWTDYDEKAQESVGIYEVTHQFVKS
ncbi:CXXC motif containing zinc binding protein isoform X3 [Monodon monoceros]|uniref:CXXC motif containing zinc binding protein isoform X3 n=1 Tax=Monodon monoceros TaxID=40151 RepID=UPI0010F8459B|nr:CXXC motif containing zinc binding protein isoform X3 [Monodon monoceros]